MHTGALWRVVQSIGTYTRHSVPMHELRTASSGMEQ